MKRRVVRFAGGFGIALALTVMVQPSAGAAPEHNPETYYFSSEGDDANDGRSDSSPWASPSRINALDLGPGDAVLFKCGESFHAGTLRLTSEDSGDAENPIRFGQYGECWASPPTLFMGTGTGLEVTDASDIRVESVQFYGSDTWPGSDPASNRGIGISFKNTRAHAKLGGIVIDGVYVRGFTKGVQFEGANNTSGYRNVLVQRSSIGDNSVAGLSFTTSTPTARSGVWAHDGVNIIENQFYLNSGHASSADDAGVGLFLRSVSNATVGRNSIYSNGRSSDPAHPGAGARFLNVKNLIVENNGISSQGTRAHPVRGLDFAGGIEAAAIQYNFSTQNNGPAFYFGSRPHSGGSRNTILRYNISSGDVRGDTRQGAIHLKSGRHVSLKIINNTVFVDRPIVGSPRALRVERGVRGITIRNNIFQVMPGGILVDLTARAKGLSTLVLNNNAYWPGVGRWRSYLNGTAYPTLKAWKRATGQESNGISTKVAFCRFAAYSIPEYYTFDSSSGLDSAAAAILPEQGSRDYLGNELPSQDRAIGAVEKTNQACTGGIRGYYDGFCCGVTTIDQEKWYVLAAKGASVFQDDGLNLAPAPNTQGSRASLRPRGTFNLKGGSTYVELLQVPNPSTVTTAFLVQIDDANKVFLHVASGNLSFRQAVRGKEIILGTAPYDNSAMRWLRIRETDGVTYGEYASAHTGPWTEVGSAPTPIDVREVEQAFSVEERISTPNPGRAVYRELNETF